MLVRPLSLSCVHYRLSCLSEYGWQTGLVERFYRPPLAFAGVTGVTNIDANRDASKPAAIIAIKGGKLEFLKTVAP